MARKWVRIPVIVAAVAAGVLGLSVVLVRQSVEPESRITICSFNIQFLGHFTAKENASLAEFLKSFDAVVVQKLVAPPYPMDFPDGSPATPDAEARAFFEEMAARGFDHVLSEEDTGPGEEIHNNGPATEWWVAFYKGSRLGRADDLPHGFLAEDRSKNEDYERVPYAFALRTPDRHLDFVLVSVHLRPDDGRADRERRAHELAAAAAWVDQHDEREKDFIILGDMNIQNAQELAVATPGGFVSLNDECLPTTTNPNSPRPYDHVMFRPQHTREMDLAYDVKVVDLVEAMRGLWTSAAPYPGDPYEHDAFRQHFSDHRPVLFRLRIPSEDDDP